MSPFTPHEKAMEMLRKSEKPHHRDIFDTYQNGMSDEELSKKYNISKPVIHSILMNQRKLREDEEGIEIQLRRRNKIPKYRKKSVPIEAIQLKIVREIPCKFGVAKEYNEGEIADFIGNIVRTRYEPNGTPEGNMYFEIETLEGTMKAALGDYIIKDENGEIYSCSPDIFYKTYESIR